VARVGRDGWSAVPVGAREEITDPMPDDDAYRLALAEVDAEHACREPDTVLATPGFARFVEAQLTWDRAMAQALDAGVHGVALGDAVEMELGARRDAHPFVRARHATDRGAGRRNDGGNGRSAAAPEGGERSRRHVEGTAGAMTEHQGAVEQVGECPTHGLRSPLVKARQLTGRIEAGEDVVEVTCLRETIPQHDAHPRFHEPASFSAAATACALRTARLAAARTTSLQPRS
jgi:hypothetical protein